jgi:proteasome lid subunit RPN8/RPN11
VKLPDAVAAAILAHARQTAPAECCGLLIGSAEEIVEAVAAVNVADEPLRRYVVDPGDHLRALRTARGRGLQVIGAYHSHPRTAALPSETDAAQAFGDFLWLIVGGGATGPEIRAWEWLDGNFVPVALVRVRVGEG